jgi:predicted LPLAT superfamily acyltransferase
MTGPGTTAWSGRSHGGSIGHRLVHLVARLGGPALCYLFIIPPTIVLFLRLHERRRICMRYWRRMRPGLGRWGQAFMAFRHFYSFARLLADRFLISAAPGALSHRSLGFATLQRGAVHPQGCVMLSAHVGNWELSGRFLDGYRLGTTHLVMLQAEDPAVAAQVRAALDARHLGIIDLKDPFAASLEIAAALRRGETCCMLGDRTAGSQDGTLTVTFCASRGSPRAPRRSRGRCWAPPSARAGSARRGSRASPSIPRRSGSARAGWPPRGRGRRCRRPRRRSSAG